MALQLSEVCGGMDFSPPVLGATKFHRKKAQMALLEKQRLWLSYVDLNGHQPLRDHGKLSSAKVMNSPLEVGHIEHSNHMDVHHQSYVKYQI